MTQNYPFKLTSKSLGDRAVDGLLAGAIGGMVMLLVLFFPGWLNGLTPLAAASLFDASGGGNPLTGSLLHLATAGIYGMLFYLVPWPARRPWLLGIGFAYGAGLWVLAVTVMRPMVTDLLAGLTPAGFLLGHLAYGLALGWWPGQK